jgi:hypothetical protein
LIYNNIIKIGLTVKRTIFLYDKSRSLIEHLQIISVDKK